MNTYFKINYEFDKNSVLEAIDTRLGEPGADYICVADGVILNTANRHKEYLKVVNGGMFSICDSSYVPLYIRFLYGIQYRQYCRKSNFSRYNLIAKVSDDFLGNPAEHP